VTALEALRTLGQQLQLAHSATLSAQENRRAQQLGRVERLSLPVVISLTDRTDPQDLRASALHLVESFRERLAEAQKAREAFQDGRVYCFWCDAAACVHTHPPHEYDTFAGYSPVGRPEWISFPNLCIARNDDRVDLLYEHPPEVIAVMVEGQALAERHLQAFGKGSLIFSVLGQVVAGLVPKDLNVTKTSPQRVALTFQILEQRCGLDAPRLRLNLLGLSFDDILEAASHAHPRETAEWLRRLVLDTRTELETLGRRFNRAERLGESIDRSASVRPLLNHLRSELERTLRLHRQRTLHAQARHATLERPTHHALSDARTAPTERLLFDEEHATVVVLGPKGRAHLFTPEGRHVTSLQLLPGELERKQGKARWVPMDRSKAGAFRARVMGRSPEQVPPAPGS
jgi:hypothetical protein